MRLLVIGLLVSLGALLLVAAAVARHIWLHRKKLKRELQASPEAYDSDLESEP